MVFEESYILIHFCRVLISPASDQPLLLAFVKSAAGKSKYVTAIAGERAGRGCSS